MSTKGNHRIAITTSLRLKPTTQPKQQLDTQSSLFASFANVLDDKQTQLKCYSDTQCADTVELFLKGRNCTLFVYGQTGSGKVRSGSLWGSLIELSISMCLSYTNTSVEFTSSDTYPIWTTEFVSFRIVILGQCW